MSLDETDGRLVSPFREVAATDMMFESEASSQPTLRRGARGNDVVRLQAALTAAGYPTPTDGDFGAATHRNVWAFQSARGLHADGVAGAGTWRALAAAPDTGATSAAEPAADSGVATGDPTDGTPDIDLGVLVFDTPGRQAFRYQFTKADLIWTAKLMVHEAGGKDNPDNAAVLWAMFNRYAMFTHRNYSSFAAFIRRYSTTLQPVLRARGAAARHYKSGDAVYQKTGGRYKNSKIPKGQLIKHLQLQRAPWHAVPPLARQLATRALTGQLPNPGIGLATEFASTRMYYKQRHGEQPNRQEWLDYTRRFARCKKWKFVGDVPGINPMKNAFFVQNRVSRLPDDAVRIDGPGANNEADDDVSASELLEQFEDNESYLDEWHEGPEAYEDESPFDAELDDEWDADDEWEQGDFVGASPDPFDEDESETFVDVEAGEMEIDALTPWDGPVPTESLETELFGHLADRYALLVAIARGQRDPNQLTNLVFFRRHPERDGAAIDRSEPGAQSLISEWLEIRRSLVNPMLASMSSGSGVAAPTASRTTPPTSPSPSGSDARPASLDSSRLTWPGHSEAELAFMRSVYEAHIKRSKGRFVADLPDSELAPVDGKLAQRDAAKAVQRLLDAARPALALAHPTVRIGIHSGYRPASRQFEIWNGTDSAGRLTGGGFPFYYRQAIRRGIVKAGDFSPTAAQAVAQHMAWCVASPGYSDHQDGLAFDFGTSEKGKGKGLPKIRDDSWLYGWLKDHAAEHHFVRLKSEPWHWTYRPPTTSDELFEDELEWDDDGEMLDEDTDFDDEWDTQNFSVDEERSC